MHTKKSTHCTKNKEITLEITTKGSLPPYYLVLQLLESNGSHVTAQKMEFSIKDFFSKCDQIRRKLRIWSQLMKKPLMENFIFCAVGQPSHHIHFCWVCKEQIKLICILCSVIVVLCLK